MPLSFRSGALVGVGEAMVEFAPVDGGLYAQGFAGDTLNTCWYLARLSPADRPVRYLTRVGKDALSDRLVAFLCESGLDASAVGRDAERTLGLYLITLIGAERRFSYWRDHSAARRLADDPAALAAGFEGAALIHVSGITLAIIGAEGRRNLREALQAARAQGARVSFDPNLRRKLWRDEDELKAATIAFLEIADIALPSFDDERDLWGDASPQASAARIAALGAPEIVVKNGPDEAWLHSEGEGRGVAATPARDARDTTGAGDSFNAGYLAARLCGLAPAEACAFGHRLAGEVVRWPGALAPAAAIAPIRAALPEARSVESWREGREGDAAAIEALVHAVYAKWIPLIGRLPLPMQADYTQAIAAHEFALVERDGALIGLIETEDAADHLYIVNVAVAEAVQGSGLGRRLLAHAEQKALAKGYRETRLLTNALYEATIRLYERVGYEIYVREPLLNGVVVRMRKRLE